MTSRFDSPYGVAVDSAGNVYVADTNNNTIEESHKRRVVSTLAGTAGVAGNWMALAVLHGSMRPKDSR